MLLHSFSVSILVFRLFLKLEHILFNNFPSSLPFTELLSVLEWFFVKICISWYICKWFDSVNQICMTWWISFKICTTKANAEPKKNKSISLDNFHFRCTANKKSDGVFCDHNSKMPTNKIPASIYNIWCYESFDTIFSILLGFYLLIEISTTINDNMIELFKVKKFEILEFV